jgi:predicted phage terminase large subunit-like protein
MRPSDKGRVTLHNPSDDTTRAEEMAFDALLKGLKYDPREVPPPALVSNDQLQEEIDKLKDLRYFIAEAWKLVEPATFINNWHIDAIADHLSAITNGDIMDLLVTMPPRHSKSLIITVLWPVWEWTQLPSYRWVFASYAFALSVRDSIKRRKILKSPWFQQRFGDLFTLISDQDTKIRFENSRHGFMLASSVGGSNTGEGGERIIADDPHNIKKAESEDVRTDTVNWWNIVMSTRRNDLSRSARVVVQQRTHEADVAGDIIERGGYVHLNLPTEFMFAGAPACKTQWVVKATGELHTWEDPRTEPGELLNPLRFRAVDNEAAKIDLGDYQYAAQHGQQPAPPEGTIIKKEWLKYYGGKGQPPIPEWNRATGFTPLFSLDATFKEHKDTDFVAGLGWAMYGADLYLMPIKIYKRMNFPDTIDAIAEFVGGKSLDGDKSFPGVYPFMKIKLVESKANGPAIIDTLRHRIPGMVPYEPGGASKESRLSSASWRFRAGNIYLPDESIAPWIVEYRYQLCAFPKAKHDDYVDATSQALLFIGGNPNIRGTVVSEDHKSSWVGINQQELSEHSVWGTFLNSSSKSIWRR